MNSEYHEHLEQLVAAYQKGHEDADRIWKPLADVREKGAFAAGERHEWRRRECYNWAKLFLIVFMAACLGATVALMVAYIILL